MTKLFDRVNAWARSLRRDVLALYLASRDPRTPWLVKVLIVAIVAYALSPIDLIPDFIPILGYLDDAILVPLAIWLVIRMIPREVMAEHRARAASAPARPASRIAAAVVITIWLMVLALAIRLVIAELNAGGIG